MEIRGTRFKSTSNLPYGTISTPFDNFQRSSRTCAFPQAAYVIVINIFILDEIKQACDESASYIVNQRTVFRGPENLCCRILKLLELFLFIKVWGITFQVDVDADVSCGAFLILVAVQDIATVLPPLTLSIEDFVNSVELG